MTADENEQIEAEIVALVEQLKRHLADPGRAGVSHAQYVARWYGRRIESPEGAPDQSSKASSRLRVEWNPTEGTVSVTWTKDVQAAVFAFTTDEQRQQIDREMDAAFAQNVTLSIINREARAALRAAFKNNTNVDGSGTALTPATLKAVEAEVLERCQQKAFIRSLYERAAEKLSDTIAQVVRGLISQQQTESARRLR